MLRADLAAAGIPYRDSSGHVVDFHALRHSFITHLVASGVSVKTAQTLARHSTPSLTIGRYSHASRDDLVQAIEGLPFLSAAPAPPSVPTTTCTEDSDTVVAKLAAHRQRAVDGGGQTETGPGGEAPIVPVQNVTDPAGSNLRDAITLGGTGRGQTDTDMNAGGGIRTHTKVTLRRILSPLRLPFRHAGR